MAPASIRGHSESVLRSHRTRTAANSAAYLLEIADAWRAWAAQDDGWFSLVHGELLIEV